MLEKDMGSEYVFALVRQSFLAIVILVPAMGIAAAQDSPFDTPPTGAPQEFAGIVASPGGQSVRSGRIRRITLEQVKNAVDPVASQLARMGQLSIEAARQHRLGVQADYFPKFGATFVNVHFSEFMGQFLTLRRPRVPGPLVTVPITIFGQDQTVAALTFVQPITPLFIVHQAVRVARADERIAQAKAGVPVTKREHDTRIDQTYFQLLIAQRMLTSAEMKLKKSMAGPLYAATSSEVVRPAGEAPELLEARKEFATAATKVRELTASLNRTMGWPENTELELAMPEPLVESITLQDVADKSVAANADVIEAEQTVVKAHAAAKIAKMAYVPTVAAISGYMFQNSIPAVPSNFAYGGVMASYTLFDFGKRERSIKEARAQLGMAELALQMTRAKVAANVKNSYFELERSRQLSKMAQKMGSSMALLVKVNSNSESMEAKAARADVEVEMLEADLAHRQAFAQLKALLDPQ
jgi:outer membrane protein